MSERVNELESGVGRVQNRLEGDKQMGGGTSSEMRKNVKPAEENGRRDDEAENEEEEEDLEVAEVQVYTFNCNY